MAKLGVLVAQPGAGASGLGERLLASCFRGVCLAMREAAQCCGARWALDEVGSRSCDGKRVSPAVDWPALLLSGYAPLGEIATVERELR